MVAFQRPARKKVLVKLILEVLPRVSKTGAAGKRNTRNRESPTDVGTVALWFGEAITQCRQDGRPNVAQVSLSIPLHAGA